MGTFFEPNLFWFKISFPMEDMRGGVPRNTLRKQKTCSNDVTPGPYASWCKIWALNSKYQRRYSRSNLSKNFTSLWWYNPLKSVSILAKPLRSLHHFHLQSYATLQRVWELVLLIAGFAAPQRRISDYFIWGDFQVCEYSTVLCSV